MKTQRWFNCLELQLGLRGRKGLAEDIRDEHSCDYPELKTMTDDQVIEFSKTATFECWDDSLLPLIEHRYYDMFVEDELNETRDLLFAFAFENISKEPDFVPSEEECKLIAKSCRSKVIETFEEISESNVDDWLELVFARCIDDEDWSEGYPDYAEGEIWRETK